MVYYLNLLIIFLSLAGFFVYKKTKSYISVGGLTMIVMLSLAIILKLSLVKDLQVIGFRTDNFSGSLMPLIIFNAIGVVILFAMRFKAKKFKVFSWATSLVFLYLIFGLIQQTFFQAIFAHTLAEVISDKSLVVIFSTLFYSSFHWGWETRQIRLGFLTLFAGAIWTMIYLKSPNIYLLGVSHALLASLYYFIVYPYDILGDRLSIKGRGLLKLIYH